MLTSHPRLAEAESIALDRLMAIARDSVSDHEARLAALAIFSLRRDGEAAPAANAPPARDHQPAQPPEPPPTRTPQQQPPLTPHELAQLALHLPSVKPQRFLNKHTPAYWREVLARHQSAPHAHAPLAATTGPPTRAQLAA